MGNKLFSETAIQNIASSIRNKNGTQNTYTVSQMAQAILDIPTGGQSYNNGKNNFWVYINTANTSVTITITSECEVDWGDGTIETLSTDTAHTYTNNGIYIISGDYINKITGNSMYFNIYYIEANKTAINISETSGLSPIFKAILNENTNCPNFGNATKLQEVSIPKVTSISNSAFSDCTSLTNITIPASATSIGVQAFYNCTSLITLTIPASVTSIDYRAFGDCTSMQEYHFLSTTPSTLAFSVFANIPSNCIIYVPASAVEDYKTATNWSTYASYIQAEPTVGE